MYLFAENFSTWIRAAKMAELVTILDRTADELLERAAGDDHDKRLDLLWDAGMCSKRGANLLRHLEARVVASTRSQLDTIAGIAPRPRSVRVTITNLSDKPNAVRIELGRRRPLVPIFSEDCAAIREPAGPLEPWRSCRSSADCPCPCHHRGPRP